MIRMQDIGEITYGGAVTLTEWWDDRRIADGRIAKKDIWKKASFYTYLGIGLPATLMSAFGWWRNMEKWTEHISHGFLYDMPRFVYNIVKSMSTESQGRTGSDAVKQAQDILAQRQAVARKNAALPVGRQAARSYEPEFNTVGVI